MPDPVILGRFLMYAAVGAAGTACQYAVLVKLVSAGLSSPVPASVLGACAGAIVNFLLNVAFTFRGRARLNWRTAARFFAIAALAAGANGALMALLIDGPRSLHLDYRLAQLMVTATLLGATFLVNSMWTFRASRAP